MEKGESQDDPIVFGSSSDSSDDEAPPPPKRARPTVRVARAVCFLAALSAAYASGAAPSREQGQEIFAGLKVAAGTTAATFPEAAWASAPLVALAEDGLAPVAAGLYEDKFTGSPCPEAQFGGFAVAAAAWAWDKVPGATAFDSLRLVAMAHLCHKRVVDAMGVSTATFNWNEEDESHVLRELQIAITGDATQPSYETFIPASKKVVGMASFVTASIGAVQSEVWHWDTYKLYAIVSAEFFFYVVRNFTGNAMNRLLRSAGKPYRDQIMAKL